MSYVIEPLLVGIITFLQQENIIET